MTELATLYKKSGKKVQQWRVTVVLPLIADGTATVRKIHGQVDGKLQTIDRVVKKGKNEGRANATTPYEQALLEAESAWKKQKDKGYTTDPSGESGIILPMKAQSFKKAGHRMPYPAWCQPKFNGVRCLAFCLEAENGEAYMDYRSRGGKSYNGSLAHLSPYLLSVLRPGDILDGEIYAHGVPLQKVASRVKKYYRGESEKLQYWIYDTVKRGAMYGQRRAWVDGVRRMLNCPELFPEVETVMVGKSSDVDKLHDIWVELGFEGAIVRNSAGHYGINKRTADLQKVKNFIDHEFEIIGGRPAEGTQDGCVIFRVRGEAIDKNGDKTGKVVEFDVVPKGTLDLRRAWMNDIDKLIGEKLTVRYFELSEDGCPHGNPVGVCIRDYE